MVVLKKMDPAVRITRPLNCGIGGLSIFIAAILAGPILRARPVIFAILSGLFLTAAANVINDWFDIEIDRINRPDRVLPSGRLSRQFAIIFAIILFVCGVFFSIFINKIAIVIATASVLILIGYSGKFKRMILWGNLTVSFMTGLAFIYGALAAGNWKNGIVPAIFAFLFHFGREILKDLEDVAGDAAMSANTFPIRFGRKAALTAISIIYLILIIFTLFPYAANIYGRYYFIIVLVGVDLVLLSTVAILWMKQEKANLRLLSRILKADMLVGLIAIYFGK